MSTIKTQVSLRSSGDGLEEEGEWKTTLMTNSIGPAAGPVKYLLATGLNLLTVPTGAMSLTIQPPTGSLAQIQLPGVSGATGMVLRTGCASMNPIPTAVPTMMVATSRQELVYLHWG